MTTAEAPPPPKFTLARPPLLTPESATSSTTTSSNNNSMSSATDLSPNHSPVTTTARGGAFFLSPRALSALEDFETRSRDPRVLYGRDVIQVPLKLAASDEYVNLVLSHREFDRMAVHIPQYDEMAPLALVDEITRLVKEEEREKTTTTLKHQRLNAIGATDYASDAAAVFQARVLELEFECKRLQTKLAAARALQTSVTDENTTLRMHTRELETLRVEIETVRLQNELLQEQTVQAAIRVVTLTKQAADAQRRVVATREELTQLRRLVLAEQTALATAAAETLAQLTTAVQRREALLETSIQDEKTARQAIAEKFYELSGRIRVFCRVRPPTVQAAAALLFPKPHSVLVGAKEFAFDHVFGPVSTQQDVFAQVTPLVVSFADGYNACIMAYGQTGTGKTFTMMGDRYVDDASESAGVIPRALQHVFATVEGRRVTHDDTLSVSMVEIYNDQILDLLSEDASRAGKGAAVKTENDITARPVTHWSHVDAVLTEGNANRNIAATSMNLESSRSHALVFLHLTSHHRSTRELKRSTLCLVDLAGSERIARSQVEGDRLKETQHINKSLAALGDVVYALQHKAKHTPYRNSKLTYMLREMLSGQSKTLLLLQLSPDDVDVEETTCSLNFGARVSQVQMGAVRPSVESGELVRLKDETRSLETRLKASDEKLAEWKDECRYKSEQLTEARERAKDLERQLCSQSDEVASLHEVIERTNALSPPLSPSTGGHLKTAPVSPTQSVKSTRSTASAASLPATPSSMARLTARKSLGASMRQPPLPANDPVLDSEMRRRSLSTLPTRTSPSMLSARTIRASKEAPPALPSRRPLSSPSAASSSVPPSPASASRIVRPRTSLGASASSTGASTASPSTTSGTPRTPLRRAGSLAASGGPSPATTPRASAPPVSRLEARRPLARSASGVRASGPTTTGPTAGARKPSASSIPTGPSSSSGRRGARA